MIVKETPADTFYRPSRKKMTDLEICKRIAEIEGVQHQLEMEDKPSCYVYSEHLNKEYNPLTDKALCFDLMVKYNIELTPLKRGDFLATPINPYDVYGEPDMYLNNGYGDNSPQKAICLAIIESHKDD